MFWHPDSIQERLVLVLSHFVWQGLVVSGFLTLFVAAFRLRHPTIRYAFSLTAFVVMALCPAVTWSLLPVVPRPQFEVSATVLTKPTVHEEPLDTIGSDRVRRSSLGESPSALVSDEPATHPRDFGEESKPENAPWEFQAPRRTWRDVFQVTEPYIIGIWLAGASLLSLRLLCGAIGIHRWRQHCRPLTDGLRLTVDRLCGVLQMRAPLVRVSQQVQEAVATGLLKPMILLPAAWLTELPPDMLEAVLAHELAHLRRLDLWVNLFQRVVETLLFYHPAVWWLSRRLRTERELCCDALAVTATRDPVRYAETLELVARLTRTVKSSRLTVAFHTRDGSLTRRIRSLLEPDAPTASGTSWLSGIVTLALVVAVPANVLRSQLSATQAAPEQQLTAAVADDGRSAKEDHVPTTLAPVDGAPPAKPGVNPATSSLSAINWPQWCRGPLRNNVTEASVPVSWDVAKKTNIAWTARLGTQTYSSPIVSGGRVFIGTNNGNMLDPRHPKQKDLACLVCFDEVTGTLLWQYASEKLPVGRVHDWPQIGLCSTACVEGDRVWVVTNRCEVICLDAHGFRDGENDGPFQTEPTQTELDADVIWKFDMFGQLGVRPLHQAVSSITQVDGVLLLNTSNGPDESYQQVTAPGAPSFLALDAATGRVLWTDHSAGESIVVGGSTCSCSGTSPAVATIGGVRQAVFNGREGWVYGFDFEDLRRGRTTLLWQFDCNPKTSKYFVGGTSRRLTLLASPVIWNDRVFVGTGRNPEQGEGEADLWCIDPTKRGDLSSELVFNQSFENGEKPIPHKPLCACDVERGDFTRPNPNSGAIWHYSAQDRNGDGKIAFEETFHRTVSNPAIYARLLFVVDFSGILHCLDATKSVNGLPVVYWTEDLLAACWSTPLIANGNVYVCDEDGDVAVFKASSQKVRLAENNLGEPIHGTPCATGRTLFIGAQRQLVAIRESQISTAQVPDAEAQRRIATKSLEVARKELEIAQEANRRRTGTVPQLEVEELQARVQAANALLANLVLADAWGPVTNGLRMRVVPVLATMSEDAVELAQPVTAFETPDDVALAVEIENVSDQPITLAEPRYGESFGEAKGKAASDWLGQFLFSIDYLDGTGRPIEKPAVEEVGRLTPVTGTLATPLAPRQTLRVLLRPAKWMSVWSERPMLGKQRAVVRYLGISTRVKDDIREFEKRKPLLDAASGDVVAPAVEFEVRGPGYRPTGAPHPALGEDDVAKNADGSFVDPKRFLVWGEPTNGLRAALELVPEAGRRSRWLSHGTKPTIKLHVQNVAEQPVSLASLMWLNELPTTVTNEKGDAIPVATVWYSGVTPAVRVMLKPNQAVTFDAGNLGLAGTKERAEKFEHVTNRTIVVPHGRYSLQATERFGLSFRLQDGKGNVLVPLDGDWKGELKTGATTVAISNEFIDCEIVDAVTGQLVEGTTVNFVFLKPKTADSAEMTVAHMVWGPKSPAQIYFTIPTVPEDIAQRPDRDELEVRWGVGNHPDYADYVPAERILLRQFFHEGPKSAREALSRIKLMPKKSR